MCYYSVFDIFKSQSELIVDLASYMLGNVILIILCSYGMFAVKYMCAFVNFSGVKIVMKVTF